MATTDGPAPADAPRPAADRLRAAHLSSDPLSPDEWTRVRALFPYEIIAHIASVPDRIEVTSWRTAVLSPEVAYQRLRAALGVADVFPDAGDALRWMLASNTHLSGLAPVHVLSAGDPGDSLERLLAAAARALTELDADVATSRTDAA